MKLSTVRQIYHADLMYSAALLDLAFLEKATGPDAGYRSCFILRLQTPNKGKLKDGVSLPDQYQIVLHLQAFIEKAVKTIGLSTEQIRPSDLKSLNHSLVSSLQAAGMTLSALKGTMTPEAFLLLNELHKADYGRLRYLKGRCRISFTIEAVRELVGFFKNSLAEARISAIYSDAGKLDFVRNFNSKYPLISNFMPLEKFAPASVEKQAFENIVSHKSHMHLHWVDHQPVYVDNDSLSDAEAQFIKGCYDLAENRYLLKQPIDDQTSRKLFRLFARASYHSFAPKKFQLAFGHTKKSH